MGPRVYLITFGCYGAWLHGECDAVDRRHKVPGTPKLSADAARLAHVKRLMTQEPYALNQFRREIVLKALTEACEGRMWTLFAAHVRKQHVHAVVEAGTTAERVMITLKCRASRALNQCGIDPPGRKRWARHGSTRHLWTGPAVSKAVHYVITDQGEPMAMYELNRDRQGAEWADVTAR